MAFSSGGNELLETKNQLVELANLVRKEGVLALETKAEEIKDPFLKRTIDLMVLGVDERALVESLEAEIARKEEGHTYSIPISTEKFPSNWELSTARVSSIVRYFIVKGINPERLKASRYADTKPIASNATPEGKARSSLNRNLNSLEGFYYKIHFLFRKVGMDGYREDLFFKCLCPIHR